MALNVDFENPNYLSNQSFQLSILKCPSLSPFVQGVSLPGMTFGEALLGTPFADRKEPGDKIIFSVLSVSFLVDEEMKAWMEVYDWIRGLGFPESFGQYRSFAQGRQLTGDDVYSDGSLLLYNNQGAPIYEAVFKDLFPIALGDIPFSSLETGDEPTATTADFQYTGYEIKKID